MAEDKTEQESGQRGQSRTEDNKMRRTLQVCHGCFSETVLSQDGGSLLTLAASRGILTSSQRMFHIGVGDENHQAGICQRDRGGLQGPESNHKGARD